MKELRATSANIYHIKQADGSFVAHVEVILIASEPGYKIDDAGELVKVRGMETFRFSAGVKQIDHIISDLLAYKDAALKSQGDEAP